MFSVLNQWTWFLECKPPRKAVRLVNQKSGRTKYGNQSLKPNSALRADARKGSALPALRTDTSEAQAQLFYSFFPWSAELRVRPSSASPGPPLPQSKCFHGVIFRKRVVLGLRLLLTFASGPSTTQLKVLTLPLVTVLPPPGLPLKIL